MQDLNKIKPFKSLKLSKNVNFDRIEYKGENKFNNGVRL
jgi:hypothetical protein